MMQYVIVFSFCLALLLASVAGQGENSINQADAFITTEARLFEYQLVAACKNVTAANTAAGAALQWAITDAINRNPRPSQSASLAANASQAVARFIANFTQNNLIADQALVSTRNLIAKEVAAAMNGMTSAFADAEYTPAQQAEWVQTHRVIWLGFEIIGNTQCAMEVAKSKASLDTVNARIQRAVGNIRDNSVLAAAIGQYANDAIRAAKASMDNDVAVLRGNEVLDSNIQSILKVA